MPAPSFTPTVAGRRVRFLALILAAVVASVTCTGPTETPGLPPGDDPSPTPGASLVTSLELAGPDTLIVHEASLLTVTARDAQGRVVTPTSAARLASSNPEVLLMFSDGVIRGLRRGSVTISAKIDTVTVRRTVVVKARVIVRPVLRSTWRGNPALAAGDSMRYEAEFVDLDGVNLGPAPTIAWFSSDPAALSVDSAGWVTAHLANQTARIGASTLDGQAETDVSVTNVIGGLPATARLIHALEGAGPITFRTNRAAPVTLSFGQSVTLPVTSGSFQVEADGMPLDPYGWRNYYAMVSPGESISIYASTGRTGASLAAAWDPAGPIPADSGLVRLIQGSNGFPVVYLLDTEAPLSGRPELCYFDPGDPTPYFVRAAGTFDLVMRQKAGLYFDSTAAYVRRPVDVSAGHAVTLVLLGNTPGQARYLTFTDR